MFNLMKTVLLFTVMLFLLAACGKGETPAGTKTATVSGVASKGPIKNGNVTVTDLAGKVLATGTTNSDGSYSIDLFGYKGPVIVKITGGEYIDEATGSTVLLANTMPNGLRAAFANASGATRVIVTPLTEIAVQKAVSAGLTATSIGTANSAVSTAFGIDNIIATLPVMPAGAPSATQTNGEKYANALANIAIMAQAQPNKTVTEVINANFAPGTINNDGSWVSGNSPQAYRDANAAESITIWPNKISAITSGGISLYAKAKNAALGTQVTFTIPSGQALSGKANFGGVSQSVTVAIAEDQQTAGLLYATTLLTSPVAGSVTVKAAFSASTYSTSSATTVVSFVDKAGQFDKTVRLSSSGAQKISDAAAVMPKDLTYMNIDLVSSQTGGALDVIGTDLSSKFTYFEQRDATTTRAILSNSSGVPLSNLDPLFTITYGYSSVIPSFTVAPVGKAKFGTYSTTLTSGDFVIQ